jgi:Beta-galactosidase/Beta-galactosidase trimerisation domain
MTIPICVALGLAASSLFAGEIVFPPSVERTGPVPAIYRLNGQITGTGTLTVRWTDSLGRVVEDRTTPLELIDENQAGFTIDTRKAVAIENQLQVRVKIDGKNEGSSIGFVARPPDRTWWDYHIMMWQQYPAQTAASFPTIGIAGGQFGGRNTSLPDFLLKNNLRWYAENLATDFYSEYHRYRQDRKVNWAFTQVKDQYKSDPASLEPFKRHPSLNDGEWLRQIHDRLVDATKRLSPYRPIFYSLGDETGIADLSAFWDFDFSDVSLVGMRKWLRERYGSLAALNRQWGSAFTNWDLVRPAATNEAMKRSDENYSSWADFKEWMDVAFAGALKMGTDAIHSVDPDAYVSIGGGQMPGWGGYDYARITQSLNAIEPYDIGNNIEIIRSLNPRMRVVTTSFQAGDWEKHRAWYEMLHGNRGMILWDEKHEYFNQDGTLGPRGLESKPYFTELTGGIAALLNESERMHDGIAIHYSQSSMRTEWMLAQRGKGDRWTTRNASTDRLDSDFMRVRESYCRAVEDQGLQYNFVSYSQIENRELAKGGYRVLMLPRSTSLSAAEVSAIRNFVEQGGILIADGAPGAFDEHSRKLPSPSLADLFAGLGSEPLAVRDFGRGKVVHINLDILNYHQDRVAGREAATHRAFAALFGKLGIRPKYGLAVAGVEVHTFRNGGVEMVALMNNPQLRVNELGPPDFKDNRRFEKTQTVRLTLPVEAFVYDVRAGKPLGRKSSLDVAVNPYEPSVFAFTPVPLSGIAASAPDGVKAGDVAEIAMNAQGPARVQVVHVTVTNPSGRVMPHYSGNVRARMGRASGIVPFAVNDEPGTWRVRLTDVLSGSKRDLAIQVAPR